MLNYLTYNGKKSTDLGVYVTGSGSFDAAELDVDRYEVAGRNGDIIIPKNRYKNIPISYPAFIPKGFDGKAQSVRNWLRSAKTYARLDDTYDVNHFRLGLANGVQSFEPVNRNDASNFQLSFDCRPERFLKTGETPLTIEPEAHSYSGEIVSFETVAVDDMTKAEVTLAPIQSLNGYDHPWAAGAGKNLFRMDKNGGETLPLTTGSGVTFKVGSDKAIIEATGTASGAVECILSSYNLLRNYITIPAGTYTISVEGLKAGMRFIFSGVGHNGVPYSELTNTASQQTVTVTDGTEPFTSISLEVDNGIATNTTIKIQIEAGTEKTSWTPYSNVCPITGHDSATLYRTSKNLIPNKTHQDSSSRLWLGTDSSTPYYLFLKAGTYTLSASLEVSARFIIREYSDTANTDVGSGSTTPSGSFTLTKDGNYSIWLYKSGITAADVNWFQLEQGSPASSYEPYVGNQYPATFPQTVYGGTFDWVSGKLVVTHELKNLKNSNPSYIGTYDKDGKHGVIINYVLNVRGTYLDGLCNMAPVSQTPSYDSNQYMFLGVNTRYLYWVGILDAMNLDINGFKTWLAANDVYVTVPLATPVEIDLTPAQVQTLLGLNNVWSDGQISALTYKSNQFIPKYDWFETWNMPKITRNNGTVIVLPYPQEYTPEIYDVDAATTGRNAAGTMIRDRVARKHKFNYKFPPLSQADATEILNAVQDVSFTLTTASPETGAKTNYRVYVGDRSLPVYWMPTHDNASWLYSSLSLNLIEM